MSRGVIAGASDVAAEEDPPQPSGTLSPEQQAAADLRIVGPLTRARALELGITLPVTTPPLPSIPQHYPHVLSRVERERHFGVLSFVWKPLPGNPQNIMLSQSWQAVHLMTMELQHPTFGTIHRTVHKDAAQGFLTLWHAWESAGVLTDVLSVQTFCARFKRTLGTQAEQLAHCRAVAALPNAADFISTHAWGAAWDINAGPNQQGHPPVPIGEVGTVLRLIGAAEELHFAWGGHFHTVDAEHFEVGT